jgi:hypothetical protein
MLVNDDAARLIEEAIDNIKTYGWVRGKLGNKKLGFCAVGAMITQSSFAQGRLPNILILAMETLGNLVRTKNPNMPTYGRLHDRGDIATYNNLVAKSAEDVIDVMMEAAKLLRNAP